LDSDQWEFQESNKKQGASESSHSGKSFSLALIKEYDTVQLQQDIRYFLIGHMEMPTFFFQSIISKNVLQAIHRSLMLFSYIQNIPSE